MTRSRNPVDESILRLQQRVEHLEKINGWHMYALEMLANMGAMHGDAGQKRDPQQIYRITRQYLKRLIDFDATAFLSVNEHDSTFQITDCKPENQWDELQNTVDQLIESGEFAWALNQNRPVEPTSRSAQQRILLHVLASKNRIRGMFIGVINKPGNFPSAPVLNLMSVILHNCASALESSALYTLIREHNKNLEKIVAKRTRELEHQYGHDSLTGLPNRLLFQDRMKQAIARARRHKQMVTVLLLDLDMFKRVNDTFGHAAGDELIKTVGKRLVDAIHGADTVTPRGEHHSMTVSRLGGDEFGILITDLRSIDSVMRVIKRVIESVSESLKIAGNTVHMTCSMGLSLYPNDGLDPESLLRNADVAMYHAKRQGRNNYQFYCREINATTFQQLVMENQLRHAVDNEEFILYYQPKVEVRSGRICGMEALIRWDHPQLGIVGPTDFIPIAEETGLIIPIGEWVLRTACAQAAAWVNAGVREISVAVNLSAQQFRQKNLLEQIVETLDAAKLDPCHLELEITESTLMEDIEAVTGTLTALHNLGVKLSIDDFGTGYSSLSYLKQFPIDTLKIDRSFVRDIPGDPDDVAIVTAIIAMAHSMGLKVIAEGVETDQQLAFLQALRCNEIQGYLFHEPVARRQATEILTSDRSRQPQLPNLNPPPAARTSESSD
jgi:diguanylate cyclase (GGDEF)-like protein